MQKKFNCKQVLNFAASPLDRLPCFRSKHTAPLAVTPLFIIIYVNQSHNGKKNKIPFTWSIFHPCHIFSLHKKRRLKKTSETNGSKKFAWLSSKLNWTIKQIINKWNVSAAKKNSLVFYSRQNVLSWLFYEQKKNYFTLDWQPIIWFWWCVFTMCVIHAIFDGSYGANRLWLKTIFATAK